MPKPMRRLLLSVSLILAGCASQSAREADAPYIAQAESRIRAGDYAGAAEIYRDLVNTSSAPDYYRMMAADAELRAGNSQVAESLLGEVHADELVVSEQDRYTLLQARLYLNQGRAREAMSLLDTLSPQTLNVPSRAHYHTLRASAYNQLGNMVESARERIRLGEILRNPEAIDKNNEAIYDALNQVPDQALGSLRPAQAGTLSGWIDLVTALRQPTAKRAKAVQAWRSQYAGHPADGVFLESHLGKGGDKVVEIKPLKPVPELKAAPASQEPKAAPAPSGPFVGVLLPLSGSFGPAAQAVRTGMTAAQEADPNPGKPSLKFVDTQGGSPYALYQQLAGEGAQWVVGPLTKEELATLGTGGELSTPVLALNQNPDLQRDRLYQFALTPEQEVEQSAGSAWFDGKQAALVLAPSSAFGQRVINHFSKYWKSLGGKIAAIKTYKPGSSDFTGPVHDLLAAVPGGLAQADGAGSETAPGADFVFLIADARDGRLLRPQLETQQGTQFPIYATSQIFSGRTDAGSLDRDLNGVIFCDIPWTLNEEDGPLSRRALSGIVERTPESYLRLVAMGIDAYQLLGQMDQLRAGPQNRYNGATGQLNLQAGNRIQRQLQCAQFDDGLPHSRGVAPLLQPSAAGTMASP